MMDFSIALCFVAFALGVTPRTFQDRMGLNRKFNPLFTMKGYFYSLAALSSLWAFINSAILMDHAPLLILAFIGYIYVSIDSFVMSRRYPDRPYIMNPYSREVMPEPLPNRTAPSMMLITSNISVVIATFTLFMEAY